MLWEEMNVQKAERMKNEYYMIASSFAKWEREDANGEREERLFKTFSPQSD